MIEKRMKKISSIVLTLALLLSAISCTDLLDENLRGLGAIKDARTDSLAGARVNVGFNVPMPVATKAMTEDPTITSMHVFVFIDNGVSDNGVLLEVQPATLAGYVNANAEGIDVDGNFIGPEGKTVIARWETDLLMGRGKRRLHFVANLPEDFEEPAAGSAEFTVMRSIQTTGGDVAYWQMKELENGILAYTYDGTGGFGFVGNDGTRDTANVTAISGYVTGSLKPDGSYQYTDTDGSVIDVAKGDYITSTGQKVLDGKGFYASCEVANAVSEIALIRNFTRIKVLTTSTAANASNSNKFHLKSAVLINTPQYGYAVPFDDVHNSFVTEYRNSSVNHKPTHATIYNAGDGYPASVPLNSIVTDLPNGSKQAGHETVNGYTRDSVLLYMYERGIPTQNATAMLVCGTMGSSTQERWFKIEISDEDGAYYPFYRDFTYEVEIKSITGSPGYDTMEGAYGGSAVGDISNSSETTTLTRIDDGNGLTLWVEYIDYTSVSEDSTKVTLLYKFYKGSENYTSTITPEIVSVQGREAAVKRFYTEPYRQVGLDQENGWYQATVVLYGSGSETKISKLRISGTRNNKTLRRDVEYHVMEKQDLTIRADNLASEDAGETTTLYITLPRYLGYSVFPLTLMIEAAKNNLNPGDDENLSVESGPSIIPGGTTNSFHFLKTINFSEYKDVEDATQRTYQVELKTTRQGTAANTNGTAIYVVDQKPYFNVADCSIIAGGPIFRANNVSVSASETSATFTIVSRGDENKTWTLTPNSDDITITNVVTKADPGAEVTGEGDADVTVALPGENTTTEDQYYYLTATRQGFPPVTITITQRGKVVSVSPIIPTTSDNFNGDYQYTGEFSSDLAISFVRGNNLTNSYIELNRNSNQGNATGTKPSVTITAKKITRIVVTWSTDYAVSAENTSISAGGGTIEYQNSQTIWTNNNGADTVTLDFAVVGRYATRPRIEKIQVTYQPEN